MKFDPQLSDEPLVAPGHPGLALVRLSRLLGAIDDQAAQPNAVSMPTWNEKLARSREGLLQALENDKNVGTAFENAQTTIRALYAWCLEQNDEARAQLLTQLDFPDPTRPEREWVEAIDVSTVVLTHFKPFRQVFTTIAFDESHGATAYWLHEERAIGKNNDHGWAREAVMENWAPQFTRIRMPIGKHRLIIESRNSAYSAFSEPFEIEVPKL